MRCLNKDFYGAELQPVKVLEAIANPDCGYLYYAKAADFAKIPGSPTAYWISQHELNSYNEGNLLGKCSEPRKGLDTGENFQFLRYWYEVNSSKTVLDYFNNTEVLNQDSKWFPYNKGGDFRKWYGNREYLINWKNNGIEIKSRLKRKKQKPTLRNQGYYFRDGFTWTTVSSSNFSARYSPHGALFDNGGCTIFSNSKIFLYGAFLNSTVANRYLAFLAPTLNFQPGDIGNILYRYLNYEKEQKVESIAKELVLGGANNHSIAI